MDITDWETTKLRIFTVQRWRTGHDGKKKEFYWRK